MVLLIALPLMDCLSLLLKIGRTLRGKVSHIFTLEALDVSIVLKLAVPDRVRETEASARQVSPSGGGSG